MDNLEQYIRENREAFDAALPDLKVWGEIDKRLERRPSGHIVRMKRLRIAAAVALLITAGGVIGSFLTQSHSRAKSLADISPEHAEMERFFNSQVQEKMTQLASYEQAGAIKADMETLDAMYEQLKEDLQNAPPGAEEQVIQAMIHHYQTKIDILERVLERVQTTNPANSKTAEHEISI